MNISLYFCEGLRMKKKMKVMLKKDISGKEKQKNIESKKNDFRFTIKNTSHLKRLKKTTTTTKNKPKILQKSMTNSCLWSHCDW